MNLPKLILVAVDPAMRPTAATRRALEIARRAKSRVHLCMPVFDVRIDATAELVHPEVERLAREQYIETRMRWLAAWSAELVEQGVDTSCEVIWAKAAHEALLARVIEMSPDLVVKDLVRESFLRRWSVVRSAESRLARLCPAPLMLVQEDAPAMPARIGVAVDPTHPHARPSELDDAVVKAALPLAMLANAPLDLMHVFPHRRASEGRSATLDAKIEDLRREDADAFAKFAARYSVPPDRRSLLSGEPAEELLRHAEEKRLGLLVIGSQYLTAVDRFLLGSTAESLISQSPCDLLLVRPTGFRDELARHQDLDALRERYAGQTVS